MREIIWALIAALFAYVVYQVWRALRVKPVDPPETATPAAGADTAADADDDEDEAFVFDPVLRSAEPPAQPEKPASDARANQAAVRGGGVAEAADKRPEEVFQLELEVRQLRRDIAQLRNELAEQRRETERLGAEQRALRDHMESTLASHGISPEYNEALVFARRGMDVATIADRCSISVAEAELVQSLARGASSGGGSGVAP